MIKIPHVPKHDRLNTYGYNNKKWCKCGECVLIRCRYDKIYSRWNFINKLFLNLKQTNGKSKPRNNRKTGRTKTNF